MISNSRTYLQQIKNTSLVDLVQSQNFQIIHQLIEIYHNEGVKLININCTNSDGFSPLHKACARGIPEIVELLLKHGADPNVKNSGGETPAHLAARRGNPITLNILQNYNANLHELDNKGQNIVHNAVIGDSVLVLLWIETSTEKSLKSQDSSGITPLHLSCILGKTNCIKFFLRKSYSDINEKTNSRDNCLHLVIKYQQLKCIPLILFHSPIKISMLCNNETSWNQDKSLILTSKNSDYKTPLDLFNELPDEFRSKNRSFSYLFVILVLGSLKQMEYNFLICRILLFLYPTLIFIIGILLSLHVFPNYQTIVFPITSIVCIAFIHSQSHRVSNIDTRQNSIFAGAFISGVFHDLLCFKINTYTYMKNEWEIKATVIILPLFLLCYLRLIVADPGKLQLSEISTSNFSTFLTEELSKTKLNNTTIPFDRFCQVCESVSELPRVKHCKLCNMCIVNLDHHCLFLMKCIARNNIRNFIFLIIFSLVLIILFLEMSVKTIMSHCGPISGTSPLPYLYCSYTKQTWISSAILFNTGSLVWGGFMLYSQLISIGYNSTYYYKRNYNLQYPLNKIIYRIVYFMITGRYYVSSEERKILLRI